MIRSVFLRYPEGKAKAVTFSYDDGILSDKRLADLLADYGMKATFNLSNCASRPAKFSAEEIREIFLSRGHEIAVHGANHRANGNTRPIEGIRDVLECRLYLESLCDRIVRGMAYPDSGITRMGNFGSYAGIKQYLTELDIVYARTLAGDNDQFRLPDDFHAWMPSAHHDNPAIMEYIDKFLALDLSPKTYHAARYPRLFYIWGHTFEFDRKDNWDHIEEICKKFDSAREEIWFATNIEIYDYVQAYKSLVWSADGYKVYNPTLLTVWVDVDGVLYRIGSGETARIEDKPKK
jgi:peptidoglycan/xylan/chitin deacetylase (PgdA/CDA1 family)